MPFSASTLSYAWSSLESIDSVRPSNISSFLRKTAGIYDCKGYIQKFGNRFGHQSFPVPVSIQNMLDFSISTSSFDFLPQTFVVIVNATDKHFFGFVLTNNILIQVVLISWGFGFSGRKTGLDQICLFFRYFFIDYVVSLFNTHFTYVPIDTCY